MAKKRVRITMSDYNELVEAHDWCRDNEFRGFQEFYGELLGEHHDRRTVPREIERAEEQRAQVAEDRQ